MPHASFSTDRRGRALLETAAPWVSVLSDQKTEVSSSTPVERGVERKKSLENNPFFIHRSALGWH